MCRFAEKDNMIEVKKLTEPDDKGVYEISASELYELRNNVFGQNINVKHSFRVNETDYTLYNGVASQSMPIRHKGIDLVKHSKGVFKVRDFNMHIEIISVKS